MVGKTGVPLRSRFVWFAGRHSSPRKLGFRELKLAWEAYCRREVRVLKIYLEHG